LKKIIKIKIQNKIFFVEPSRIYPMAQFEKQCLKPVALLVLPGLPVSHRFLESLLKIQVPALSLPQKYRMIMGWNLNLNFFLFFIISFLHLLAWVYIVWAPPHFSCPLPPPPFYPVDFQFC
jgi:hypothetical protein